MAEAACFSCCIRYFILFRNALGGVEFDHDVCFVDRGRHPQQCATCNRSFCFVQQVGSAMYVTPNSWSLSYVFELKPKSLACSNESSKVSTYADRNEFRAD